MRNVRLASTLASLLLPWFAHAVQAGGAPGMHYRHEAGDPVVIEVNADVLDAMRPVDPAAYHLPEDLKLPAKPYRVGPADTLAITVWNHPELERPGAPNISSDGRVAFVVQPDGMFPYPYVGEVRATGKSVTEIAQSLTAALSRYIRDPQVTVRVVDFRSQRVFVEGAVQSPGAFPMTDVPMTLALALTSAGGIAQLGDASHVILSRDGRETTLDLNALSEAGQGAERIHLLDGDRIRVLARAVNPVYVTGEVVRPSPVPMNDGRLTLADALAQSGSVSAIGSNPRRVYVVRAGDSQATPTIYHFDGKSPVGMAMAARFPLRPFDLVYVETSALMRWNRLINLLVSTSQSLYNTQRTVVSP